MSNRPHLRLLPNPNGIDGTPAPSIEYSLAVYFLRHDGHEPGGSRVSEQDSFLTLNHDGSCHHAVPLGEEMIARRLDDSAPFGEVLREIAESLDLT